jgi:CxxC motif-containing protein (DUF1111 family)
VRYLLSLCLLPLLQAPAQAADPSALAGGETTFTGRMDRQAFSHPAANLDLHARMDFLLGKAIFEKIWVPAPASTTASDGLGPLHNARSCSQCHVNAGRGHPNVDNPGNSASLLRLSVAPHTDAERALAQRNGVVGDPTYGTQLQTFATAGLQPEGRLAIDYEYHQVRLADGTRVELRKPITRVTEARYGDFHPALRSSLRIAPAMIGLGLLERIPEHRLDALSDPDDADGDGISGRINRVYDRASAGYRYGRFGWKAGHASLAQQNADALNNDLGIGNPLYPSAYGNCTARQSDCLRQLNGNTAQQDGLEASAEMMRVLEFYTAHLAVPAARTEQSPQARHGRQLFHQAGCAACHVPAHVTAADPDNPALGEQRIEPYTDLLLHDMGEGLADNHREFDAQGQEWRTAPLWGIGLSAAINGNHYYLHDGRARTLLEAILWHGGEAEPARNRVINMSEYDRTALLRFLESL